ncbi:hypothetical protein ACVW0B_002580, partial [Thermostichus sp. MS-CIW-23]
MSSSNSVFSISPATPQILIGYSCGCPEVIAADLLGCVDLSFEPKESTDEIEKTQEVPGQFVKTR